MAMDPKVSPISQQSTAQLAQITQLKMHEDAMRSAAADRSTKLKMASEANKVAAHRAKLDADMKAAQLQTELKIQKDRSQTTLQQYREYQQFLSEEEEKKRTHTQELKDRENQALLKGQLARLEHLRKAYEKALAGGDVAEAEAKRNELREAYPEVLGEITRRGEGSQRAIEVLGEHSRNIQEQVAAQDELKLIFQNDLQEIIRESMASPEGAENLMPHRKWEDKPFWSKAGSIFFDLEASKHGRNIPPHVFAERANAIGRPDLAISAYRTQGDDNGTWNELYTRDQMDNLKQTYRAEVSHAGDKPPSHPYSAIMTTIMGMFVDADDRQVVGEGRDGREQIKDASFAFSTDVLGHALDVYTAGGVERLGLEEFDRRAAQAVLGAMLSEAWGRGNSQTREVLERAVETPEGQVVFTMVENVLEGFEAIGESDNGAELAEALKDGGAIPDTGDMSAVANALGRVSKHAASTLRGALDKAGYQTVEEQRRIVEAYVAAAGRLALNEHGQVLGLEEMRSVLAEAASKLSPGDDDQAREYFNMFFSQNLGQMQGAVEDLESGEEAMMNALVRKANLDEDLELQNEILAARRIARERYLQGLTDEIGATEGQVATLEELLGGTP